MDDGSETSIFEAMELLKSQNYEGREYYSEHGLRLLCTEDVIRNQLMRYVKEHPEYDGYAHMLELQSATLIGYVRENLLKTFAILVLLSQPQLIREFQQNRMKDSQLPLVVSNAHGIPDLPDRFYDLQYQFLAPLIAPPWSMMRFWDEQYIFPFVRKNLIENSSGGLFSIIYEVEVDRSYDRLRPAGKGPSVYACKELKSIGPSTYQLYEHEVSLLMLLRNVENIVPLVSRFVHGDKRCLLFPRAEYDLEVFMRTVPHPQSTEALDQHLTRIAELASALSSMHYIHEHIGHEEDHIETDIFICHNDLVPQNVLWVEGKFMISDFGLARVQKTGNIHSLHGLHRNTSSPYSAPMDLINDGDSRPSDVWSLGCIFAEFASWSVGGSQELEAFRQVRRTMKAHSSGDLYPEYCFHENGKVKESVIRWLGRYSESVLGKKAVLFLRIVREQMLQGSNFGGQSDTAKTIDTELRVVFGAGSRGLK
ncbi:kinase-like protein [Ascobolus immersus RN42]|uniref:Kinase-like protein n=1 Tax=Ascobolus immersus RN42 TaxID=1160509 RepID=A0A3N4IH36_ASCIM|nr:kinase-like protein [Ascobolus immersus RN42]